MLGLDLSEREEVEVRGAKWTLRPVPWAKLEELRVALVEAHDARTAARRKLVAAVEPDESKASQVPGEGHGDGPFDAKMERLRLKLEEAEREFSQAKALRAVQQAWVPYLAACGELVRWGVAGVPVPLLAAVPMERETFAGQSHEVLARAVVEVLLKASHLGDDVPLVDALAGEVLKANDVDPAALLGFR
jgi:hypothetical protein